MLSIEHGLSVTDKRHLNTAAHFKFDTKCSFCLVKNMSITLLPQLFDVVGSK